MHGSVWNLPLLLLLAPSGAAQIGGTGSDGALAPKSDLVLDTTQNKGIFHFTRIDISRGVKVTIKGTHPAILRVQSTVKIAGSLRADGRGYGAGPGGFVGGFGSQWLSIAGKDGGGPGGGKGGWFWWGYYDLLAGGPGGHATAGADGRTSRWRWKPGKANGSAFPFTLVGGSGGGGACGTGSTKAGQMGGYGGGDGFVRFDSYGIAPVILGKVEPKPMALELPHIVETIPPRLGRVFGLSCASVPWACLPRAMTRSAHRRSRSTLIHVSSGLGFTSRRSISSRRAVDPDCRMLSSRKSSNDVPGVDAASVATSLGDSYRVPHLGTLVRGHRLNPVRTTAG